MARPSRKRVVNWEEDDTDAAYPSGLFGSAENDIWDSPTKSQRTFSQRPKPRNDVQRRKRKSLAGDKVSADYQEAPIPNLEVSADSEMDLNSIPDRDEPDAELDAYVEGINAYVAGFYYLEGNVFAVQGWDSVKQQATVRDDLARDTNYGFTDCL